MESTTEHSGHGCHGRKSSVGAALAAVLAITLTMVADGVGDGLRLQLWRKALDEACASRDPLQATFLNVFGDDRPVAVGVHSFSVQ